MKDQIEEVIRQYESDGDFTGCVNRMELLLKSKPKKKKNPYFVKCMELWFEFFVQEEKGMKPKITPAHGKAINDMIKYFVEYSPKYDPNYCLDLVFKLWDRVQFPYNKMTDIVMINKHFNTILSQIKNHDHAKPTFKTADEIRVERLAKDREREEMELNEILGRGGN